MLKKIARAIQRGSWKVTAAMLSLAVMVAMGLGAFGVHYLKTQVVEASTSIAKKRAADAKRDSEQILKEATKGVKKKVKDSRAAEKKESRAKTPDEAKASSVLTDQVRAQLPGDLVYDHGSFIVNGNKTPLNASIASTPYATNDVVTHQGKQIAAKGNALLTKRTRQYENRETTGNGRGAFTPAGWHQQKLKGSYYKYAINRGHLLGYALVGGLKGFDASESNPKNINTQTSWANQAREDDSKGQNYYEGLVRKALDQNKRVRYRVTSIFATDQDLVPVGNELEAKSSDGKLEFHVFVPNVQNGFNINYYDGKITLD